MAQNAMKALECDDDGQKTKKKEVGAALLTKMKPVKEGNETADEQPPQLNLVKAQHFTLLCLLVGNVAN